VRISVGIGKEESLKIAKAFNFNLGSFPMTYMGIPSVIGN